MKFITRFSGEEDLLKGFSIVPIGDRDLISISWTNDPCDDFSAGINISFSYSLPIHFGIGFAKASFYIQILGVQRWN